MPQFNKGCDIYQGFNFKKDQTTTTGFITSISINQAALTADITCKDPLNPKTDLPVVAVISDISWGTGTTDPLYFSGNLSAANRQSIALLAYTDLQKVEVVYKFTIYEYDQVANKYFKCLTSGDTEMKGLLQKNGKDLNISVADDLSTEVQSPKNYAFSVGINPQPLEQNLTLATADQKTVVKQWGVKQS